MKNINPDAAIREKTVSRLDWSQGEPFRVPIQDERLPAGSESYGQRRIFFTTSPPNDSTQRPKKLTKGDFTTGAMTPRTHRMPHLAFICRLYMLI